MTRQCIYGSPACAALTFKGPVGARQHWSCLPGSIFSAVATGLGRSSPNLREDDRALLALVAAWAAFGATPALAASIATDVIGAAGSPNEATLALRTAIETSLGADLPVQIEQAGRALFEHATGRGLASSQSSVLVAITEVQLKAVSAVPRELVDDPSGRTYVRRHLGAKAQEAFWVVPIDAGRRARAVVEVSVGAYHSVGVPFPVVLSAVVASGTDIFWVAHNHPSGDVSPSQMDVDLTEQLGLAAAAIGLHLVDHVIVGPTGALASLADTGHYDEDWGELAGPGHAPA